MTSRTDHVKRRIEEAFEDVPHPGDDRIAYSEDAWECPELNADFKGTSWRNVSWETLRRIVLHSHS